MKKVYLLSTIALLGLSGCTTVGYDDGGLFGGAPYDGGYYDYGAGPGFGWDGGWGGWGGNNVYHHHYHHNGGNFHGHGGSVHGGHAGAGHAGGGHAGGHGGGGHR